MSKIYDNISKTNFINNKKDENEKISKLLSQAKRPLLLIGGGVRNNKNNTELVKDLVYQNDIPVVTTYAGTDIISHDYSKYLGTIGIKGNRASNFAVQNCDCLLVLGSRLAFGNRIRL